jgi:hypothetical protein
MVLHFPIVTDQRRAIRISVDLPARVRSTERSVDGRAGNLSQLGLLFVAPPELGRPPLRPEPLRLELDLPDLDSPISVTGVVCWQAALGLFGIRFTDIALGVRRRLANFVIRRACDPLPLPR